MSIADMFWWASAFNQDLGWCLDTSLVGGVDQYTLRRHTVCVDVVCDGERPIRYGGWQLRVYARADAASDSAPNATPIGRADCRANGRSRRPRHPTRIPAPAPSSLYSPGYWWLSG